MLWVESHQKSLKVVFFTEHEASDGFCECNADGGEHIF